MARKPRFSLPPEDAPPVGVASLIQRGDGNLGVLLAEGALLVVDEQARLALDLYVGKELERSALVELLNRAERLTLREAALALLARRPHGRKELERKLGRRFPRERVEDCLNDLGRQGLLDDTRFARALLRQRMAGGYGPRRVQADLLARGVDRDTVRRVVDDPALAEDWQAAGRLRWSKERQPDPRGMYRRLAQAGFLAGQIQRLLAELATGLPPEDWPEPEELLELEPAEDSELEPELEER
ncbi:MAG: recombination regulator RecX [Deltaproteobacteria bacterium]|nr:recombination regulator RecX [Deltaproteobacteria bacterium]